MSRNALFKDGIVINVVNNETNHMMDCIYCPKKKKFNLIKGNSSFNPDDN